jgi:hypothetical protein
MRIEVLVLENSILHKINKEDRLMLCDEILNLKGFLSDAISCFYPDVKISWDQIQGNFNYKGLFLKKPKDGETNFL